MIKVKEFCKLRAKQVSELCPSARIVRIGQLNVCTPISFNSTCPFCGTVAIVPGNERYIRYELTSGGSKVVFACQICGHAFSHQYSDDTERTLVANAIAWPRIYKFHARIMARRTRELCVALYTFDIPCYVYSMLVVHEAVLLSRFGPEFSAHEEFDVAFGSVASATLESIRDVHERRRIVPSKRKAETQVCV